MSDMQSLRVELGERSYDIMVGAELLADAGALIAPVLASRRVIIISDKTVAAAYADGLAKSLQAEGIRSELLTVAPGEAAKSFEVLAGLMDALLACAPDRKTTIIALGGGVVGDLAGVRSEYPAARGAVYSDPDDVAGAGRQFRRRQDGD